MNKKYNIGIVGLGYVGLPLLVEFSKKYTALGFDTSKNRVKELNDGIDRTNEISNSILEERLQDGLIITDKPHSLATCNIYIITVPTPVTESKEPNLDFLKQASITVAKHLKKDDIVIYESTVYPGCTEEFCVPILEENSKLNYNKDFYCGYSPERINPGDKINTLTNIKKVTSGSDKKTSIIVDNLYRSIIDAGTHLTSSIKVAEATKAIENAQRDLNISFMNELALIFDLMGVDTNEVIDAASTKWNFLKFRPGIVGGHCISVDPYYLVHKAKILGYTPEVILSGRRVNDKMANFVGEKVLKLMEENAIEIKNSNALILGITFKENMSDIRNSKVVDVINELKSFSCHVEVVDPHADSDELFDEYGFELVEKSNGKYHAVVVAVNHQEYVGLSEDDFRGLMSENGLLVDVKGIYRNRIKKLNYWTL